MTVGGGERANRNIRNRTLHFGERDKALPKRLGIGCA